MKRVKSSAMMMMMVTSLILISFSSNAYGQQGGQQKRNQRDTQYTQGIEVPKNDGRTDGQIVRNRLEMSTTEHAMDYKEVQMRKNDRMRILNEVFDPAILMTPIKRTIRPIDTVGISPTYITQIVFPDNMRITNAVASFACHILDYNRNLLRLRPDSKTFFSGNIVLTLTDGKRNYAMTVFAERYFQEDCRVDSGEYICRKVKTPIGGKDKREAYAYAYNNLSTFYVYTNPKKIDEMEAFLLYEKLSRKTLDIQNNGETVTFKYEGVYYDIVRDDISGTVSYRGKKYRVIPRG